MNIFISWSGKTSQQIAAALREWLPTIIPPVKPFFSTSDSEKGKYWQNQITDNLDKTNFGILCLTPDNITSNWIHYEAGALAKDIDASNVIPITFGGLKPTGLEAPLSLLQGNEFSKEYMRSLVTDINDKIENSPVNEKTIEKYFNAFWPDFEKEIKEILKKTDTAAGPKKPPREQRDMIEEMLTIIRRLDRPTFRNWNPSNIGQPDFNPVDDDGISIAPSLIVRTLSQKMQEIQLSNDWPSFTYNVDRHHRILEVIFKLKPSNTILESIITTAEELGFSARIITKPKSPTIDNWPDKP